jgi:DNA-binding beta-propeller fold protein YncE
MWIALAVFTVAICHTQALAKDYLYVPSSNELVVIDTETDTIVKTVAFNDYVVMIARSPDGKRMYLNAWHSIYVLDTQTNEIIDQYQFWSDLNRVVILMGIAVSPDNNFLYMSTMITKKKPNVPRLNVLPPQLIVYDIRNKKVDRSFEIPYNCNAVVAPPKDPEHVILIAEDIFKLNVKSGKTDKLVGALHPEPGEPPLNALAVWTNYSPGKEPFVCVPVYSPESLYYLLIDESGNVSLKQGNDMVFAYSGVVSPQKDFIYAVMDEVYKIDFNSGETVGSDPLERGTCYNVQITSDGKKLYLGPGGPDISVYDTATMKRIGVIALNADGVASVMLSK